jgi:hypothetical protein
MKKISIWAKNHKWPARIVIIVSYLLLTVIGFKTGNLLAELGIFISSIGLFVFASIYFCGFILYPSKEKRSGKKATSFYIRQKSCDLMLAASTFCMLVYIGNRPEVLSQQYQSLNATVITKPASTKDSISKNYKSIKDFNTSMQDENGNMLKWKERKKLLKQQVKEIKKANDLSKGEKTLLVILSALVAAGLLILVASASCSLSCNGSEGAAALVAIGGTAVVIILLVIVIRAINGKKKRKEKQTVTQD